MIAEDLCFFSNKNDRITDAWKWYEGLFLEAFQGGFEISSYLWHTYNSEVPW